MKINRGIWFSICLFVYFLFPRSPAFSQEGFKLPSDQKRDVIPFELVNNLVIIPVRLNGTRLSFLLDTGVDSTVLFSLDDLDSLALKDSRKVRLRGLGPDGTIDAYLSNNNELRVGEAVDSSHGLFIVLNRGINFSSRMGVPVHGILGYDFFSCFVVDLNYQSGRMIIHSPKYVKERSCRKCKELPLEFYRNKPYIRAGVGTDSALQEVLLLVDSGSSDGLWLFDPGELIKEQPANYFRDFLGLGLSGNIFGKRTKVPLLELSSFRLREVGTSVPDSLHIDDSRILSARDGSLGGGVLKRFRILLDYQNSRMVLKPNSHLRDPFYYNMSGLVLEHDGLIPVREVAYFNINPVKMASERKEASGIFDVYKAPTLEYFLAPRFVVVSVRPESPADLVEIKQGDEVVSINGKPSYKYKLYEINALFSSKAGKPISLRIRRNGILLKKRFNLKKML